MDDYERSTWPFKDVEYPLANDVVYGRGGLANNHKGNKRFRSIVNTFKAKYAKCSRHEKTAMAEALVKNWRDQTPPGRFLKLNPKTGLWDDVGKKARGKCSQLLREKEDSKDEDRFDQVADAAGPSHKKRAEKKTAPPPPPPSSMDEDMVYNTPPQNREIRDIIQPASPDSVMDMPFFCVESVAKVASARKHEAEAAFTNMFQAIKIPGLRSQPRKQKLKRRGSNHSSGNSSAVSDTKPAAKPAAKEATPLGSFFGNLIPKGTKKITIQQDNAAGSPKRTTTPVVKKEEAVASIACPPMEIEEATNTSPRPGVLETNDDKHPVIPRPGKISSTKRERSIDILTMEINVKKPVGGAADCLGESEHSFSWKSLDMDLDDDPILKKCLDLYESSEHTGTASRKSTATFSLDSSSSTMDQLMTLDLSALKERFQERNTSSDSGHINAIQCWEAAYGENRYRNDKSNESNDNDSLSQPDLDDFSLMSTDSFLDDPTFLDEPYAQAVSTLPDRCP